VSIQLKDKRKIPIIQNENFERRKEIEKKATELAYFLKIPLKGNY
jgi:hypothetical protein